MTRQKSIKGAIKLYLPVPAELNVQNSLFLWGNRIVIPATILQTDILDELHSGHQGIMPSEGKAISVVRGQE